jgi:polygalacturonase
MQFSFNRTFKGIIRQSAILALGLAVAAVPRMALGQAAPTTQPTHPAPVCTVIDAQGVAGIYDVRAFGAVGDGKTIDSPAINKAIETAAAAGGGTVRFPAGIYLSYSIRLKNNITLYLDSGSKILAANKNIHGGDGYDLPEDIGDNARYQDFGHSHWHNSLIWGENLENITITGPGMIDGGLYDNNGVNNPNPVPSGRGGGGLTTQPSGGTAISSADTPTTAPVADATGGGGGGGFGGRAAQTGIMGLTNGLGQGGAGRGGRGRGGRGGTTRAGGGFAGGGGGGGGFGPGGGGGRGGRGGRGGDPFANALAALRARGAAGGADTTAAGAGGLAGTDAAGGADATAANDAAGGGGGRRGRGGPFTTDLSVPYRATDTLAPGVGNKSIALKLCKNVTLSNFSVLRGGHFCLLATGIDNLTIDGLKIDTNRDGFDIDGCRNVRISNCALNTPADDGIVLKSTWALGYAVSCENTTITNCMVCGGWETGSMLNGTYMERAPGTGRIKFGTESNAGFKNITISNCVFDRCQGLALETVDGAVIDNISIDNITMRDIGSLPIFIRLGDRRRMPADQAAVGAIRHVSISNIVAQNAAKQFACEIVGIPGHEIEDVHISNVRIMWPGGAPAGIEQVVPPELEATYPEPGMFGVMPAYGFFIRHVKGIELDNIDMTYTAKDMRPPFWLQDVQDADFFNINAQREEGVPMFMLNNVEQFRSRDVRGMEDAFKDKVDKGNL